MSIEHVPPAIATATALLWLARLLCRRWLRALIRTTLTLGAGALLLAATGHAITIDSLLAALPLSGH
ncbi:hypothetical protein MOKP106_32600 [Mycobacterium avium subsp. hominissuis]|uniref:hypothetical protein n=1 Tax=Mycobacterium avium TaxID=1764 RepID=UPI0007A0D621|nr:hypothetical protein [Mycobacterium avium]